MVVLSRANTGIWLNYAIQAIVFGSILTARAVDRARDLVASTRASLPFILGTAIVCCNVINSRRRPPAPSLWSDGSRPDLLQITDVQHPSSSL